MDKGFYNLLNKLKFTQRQGWKDRGLDTDSIAAHSYSAIAIGWLLVQQESGDPGRVVGMLTFHNLVMAKMRDVTPSSGKYDQKKKYER